MQRIPKHSEISLIFVIIIGLGLSLVAFFYVKQWEHNQIIEDKKQQADVHVRSLRQTFTAFANILYSISGLHHAYDRITRENFTRFVKHDLLAQPGIQALEWVPFVPASERQKVERKARSEGIKDFYFWEYTSTGKKQRAAAREAHYPVLFTEPMAIHKNRLGYDLGANEMLKRALEQARDQGQLTASGAVRIHSGHTETLGFRIFVPVYRSESKPVTVEQRRQKLVGFAAGVLLFNNMVQIVLRLPQQKTKDVFLMIVDETPSAKHHVLYAPSWYQHDKQAQLRSRVLWSTALEFGGRQWSVILSKTPDRWSEQTWYAWGTLVLGLLFTLGLWRYLYIILTRAHWAEALVTTRTQNLQHMNVTLNKEIQARERMTKALETSRQRFQAIFNEAAIGIAQIDLNNHILAANKALQLLLRYPEEELKHKRLTELAHPDDADIDKTLLENMLAGQFDTYGVSKRYLCKQGAVVWTNQSCSIVRDTTHPFIISMIEDITERKFAEEARLEAEKKYRDIFENAVEGIFQCNAQGHYLSVNPAFVHMFGYASAEQVYHEANDLSTKLYFSAQKRLEFIQLLETHSEIQNFEYQAYCRDKRIIWANKTLRIVRNAEGQLRYYEGIVEDVTQRKQIEEKLRYDASHDQLTGLINRAAFTAHLNETLIRLHQQFLAIDHHRWLHTEAPKIDFAVLFVDLDRFKIVNDSMGHLAGDRLLTEIAQRLEGNHCHNPDDMVARFGGDEFALMLENLPNKAALEQRIECIQHYLSQPYMIKNQTFNTTASIGVALSDPRYETAEEVLRDADTAMYEAKKQGPGKTVIFQPGMHTRVVNLLRMESDLRHALEREEFSLHYQPIISLENLHTVSLEALIRWHHPKHGFIGPDKFIPLAEETGLIKELGLWVFKTACTQLRQWQTQFLHHAHLGININVSAIQLKQPSLINEIQDIIEQTGLNGTACRIEITESAMMQDPEAALSVFNELKNLEMLLYVDDFGTGYSSLSYLQKFPIDALKIDKSFIREISANGKSAQIVEAIIALGKAFDLRIVAEGVENDFQVSMLKAAHCHHVQGFLFSKPQDSKAIEHFLKSEIVINDHNLCKLY